ncbi:exosome complex component RRP46 [Zeugodacus cucurbitae]|uniref:exosome complex component RRP46 n=1 Tax=Zeugodacus cucurbitae TaxID=28588 RepID=UPI000596A6F5|nr:exosome complex component RRP46 [Zeugodacus cucurbitae]XP_054082181.1 exosome complex component RRP46 [Zeugodacus cucurbitae]
MVTTTETITMDTQGNTALLPDLKLRPINCELNPLTRSDGSALFTQGGTCVLTSMLGPVEVRSQNLNIEKAHVECIYRPKAGIPTIEDRLRENVIRDTCESALLTVLHPRTTISIQIQELDDRCGLEACAINGACLALLIGGVPMKFNIAAIHCIVDKDDKVILDPDHCEAIGKRASFIFVFDSLEKNLVTVHTSGRFRMAQFNDAECMSRAASQIIFNFYRRIISNFHNKSLLTADSKARNTEAEPIVKSEQMDF